MLAVAISLGAVHSAAAQSTQPVVIDLAEQNGSGISGTATLTPDGDNTTVKIEVNGPVGANPANILSGDCTTNDPTPVFSLTDVDANGVSETSVATTIADLTAAPHVIVLHASATNLGTIVSCGEIVETAATATETPAASTATAAATSTAAATEATITLETSNESGVSGTATLKANGASKTDVTIAVGGVLGTNLAGIFTGTCDNLGAEPAYQLTDVDESGNSTTTVDVAFSTLINSAHALLVYDPAVALGDGSALACGDIVTSIGGTTSGPATGAGVLASSPVSGGMVALFLLAGLTTVVGGLALRRSVR
jgi:hypothetical protein